MNDFSIEIIPLSAERCRVVLAGALTRMSFEALEQAFISEVGQGRLYISVDMADVTQLSSCVFGVFVQTMALLRPMGGSMSFTNVNRVGSRVLAMLGMECVNA